MRNEFVRMSAEEYHADPCPPSLSASIAHVMLRESPEHAYLRHPRLGNSPRSTADFLDRGALAHRLILGVGGDVAIVSSDSWRSKKAQAQREEARASHKIPVLERDHAVALVDAERVKAKLANRGVVLAGESEVAALWGSQTFGGAMVQCRGMLDHLDGVTIYDLKTCRSAHPEACQRHIDDYGYAVQHAAYVEAVETLKPTLAGRIKFVFVFFELEPPYAVTPIRLSGEFRELGKRRWRRAVETWERCIRTGEWPGYTDGIIEIEPRPWALTQDTEEATRLASKTWTKKGDSL